MTPELQVEPATPPRRSTMPRAVVALGFVSLLMDVSSEMVHSLLPAWLIGGLGASAVMLGLIEGVAEATALMVKVVSGALSDASGRRKPWALVGYGLGAASKPLFALAPTAGWVLGARLVDRVGKGLRGAPRDALIADVTPSELRGAAYGLRQSLDTVGALVGPLIAIGLMLLWHDDVRAVFAVAIVPGALAVLVLWRFVQEPAARSVAPADSTDDVAPAPAPRPWQPAAWRTLDRRLLVVMAIGAAGSLARISEAFLVLRAGDVGLTLAWTPLVLIALNVVYAAAAWPMGRLADRLPRAQLLILGMFVLVLADLLLAWGHGAAAIWAGIALWGLHLATTQGLLAAMVADAAPTALRGTAFGAYHFACGLAMLGGNAVAGWLWQRGGAAATFAASAVCAVLVAVAVALQARSAAPAGR